MSNLSADCSFIPVLIIDDEKDIREGLANLINWEDIGFSIIGEAANGREALDIIEQKHPAVVISDIKMPDIDGIELIRILHHSFPEIKVVLLSGYSDIAYYKEALQNSVFDYILKPSSTTEIIDVFKRLQKTIGKDESNRISNVLACELFLNRMLTSEYTEEYIEEESERLGLYVPAPPLRLVITQIKSEEFHIYSSSAALAFKGMNQNAFILIHDTETEEIKKILSEIITQSCHGDPPKASISKSFSSLEEIGKAYNQVLLTEKEHMLAPEISFLFYENLSSPGFWKYGEYDNLINDTVSSVMENNHEEIERNIEKVFSVVKENAANYDSLDYLCSGIYYRCLEKAVRQGTYITPVSELHEFLGKISDINEMKNYLRNLLFLVATSTKEYSLINSSKTIKDIDNIITEEYANPQMSLTYISTKIGKSEAYLSSIYKAETGSTILSQITQQRIEKAKKLLKETNLKTYRIAIEIGYTDCSYFSKLFRRITGYSPVEYRNKA